MSVRRKPNGRYQVRWREGGRRYGRTFDRLADAKRFDLEVRRRRQLGGLIAPDLDTTLIEFARDWWRLHVVPNLSAHTKRIYLGLLRTHLLPVFGQRKLREITPRVVSSFRADSKRAGVGEPTIRQAMLLLQSILRLAVEEERIESNPVAKVRKPRQAVTRRVDPIPPTLVEAMRAQLAPRDATLISVLAYAGLRPGEALAMRWRCVGERTLRVERAVALGEEKPTKTGRSRSVRLLAPLAEDLARWRELCDHSDARDLLFPRPDSEPWQEDDWHNWRKRIFRPAAQAVGLDGARPYDLRSSFVSLLIFEGQTVIEVARQAGHSAEMCLRHYARVFDEYDPERRVPAEGQISAARAATRHVGGLDDH